MHRNNSLYCLLLVFLFAGTVLGSAWAEEAGMSAVPDFERLENPYDRFFVGSPDLTGFEGSKAFVEVRTDRPALPMRIVYGPEFMGPRFPRPLFRKWGTEPEFDGRPMTESHRLPIDLAAFEKPQYGRHLIDNHGGILVYRIEGLEPDTLKLRVTGGRFAYRRAGKPGEGVYRRVPCLSEGPFVDRVTDRSAVISWDTDAPTSGRVILIEPDGGEIVIPVLANPAGHHEIGLPDLSPSTEYRYRVDPGADGFASFEYSFRTAPRPGSREPFRFVFLSDCRAGAESGPTDYNGINGQIVQRLLQASLVGGAAFVAVAGDLANGYTTDLEQYNASLHSWKELAQPVGASVPLLKGLGNHECAPEVFRIPDRHFPGKAFPGMRDRADPDSIEAIFSRHFVNPEGSAYGFPPPPPEAQPSRTARGPRQGPAYGETVFSWNWDNVHIVMLNSNYWTTGVKDGFPWSSRNFADREGNFLALEILGGNREGYLMPRQLEWLERDLRAAQSDPAIDTVMVITHEPPFPCGGHQSDAMFWGTKSEPGQGLNKPGRPLGDVTAMRDRFLGILMEFPKVKAILCGDEHNYSRLKIDSSIDRRYRRPIWQIISGGGGAPYYLQDTGMPWEKNIKCFAPFPNYCRFDIDGKSIRLTALTDNDEVIDQVEHFEWVR